MSHRFDATLKDLLGQDPKDFESVPVFGLPKIAPSRALNVDLSTISAATDVAFGFGDPLREIADLNFQSGPDVTLPDRLMVYNGLYRMRFGVRVCSVLILLRPKADAANLTGRLLDDAGDTGVDFRYRVVRMWQQQAEPFLQGGLGLLPLATLCEMASGQDQEESLKQVVHEIDRRLAQEADHARAVRLMTAAFILTGMRVEKESLAGIYEGVRIMHESTAFDMILDEGELRGEIKVLIRLGTRKFGAPDAPTASLLQTIKDVDRLDRIADAMLTANSWQELLATP